MREGAADSGEQPPVVVLHGLGRTRLAMIPLCWHLRRQGREVINLGYFGPLGLERAVDKVARLLEPYAEPLDFVTHSMGGIVARAYLGRHPGRGRRLVQLAPPNEGSHLADRVRRIPLLSRVPAFFDLGRGVSERKTALPALEGVEVGVIAGASFGPWLSHPGDGIVAVEETYLPEARDWIVLPHFHTLIMNGRDTWANVLHFFAEGAFRPQETRLQRSDDGSVVRVGEPIAALELG
ncbi:MAG TPA: acetyltransferase [Planctomycetes bacterium]|nr:acetyltransferase [Planctomycetota bacterium]